MKFVLLYILWCEILSLFSDAFRFPGLKVKHPQAVAALNTYSFVGRWYQTYSSWVPSITFEKDGFCVVTDYAFRNITNFQVVISENTGSPTGAIKQATGEGFIPHQDTDPGMFQIEFVMPDKSIKKQSLLVVRVGEVDPSTNEYQWAVLSDRVGVNLFILARDVQVFREKYQTEVLVQCGHMGFVYPFNRPRSTYQGPDCNYPALANTVGERRLQETR